MQIQLVNDFHNTQTTVRPNHPMKQGRIEISKSLYVRIKKDLCGIKDCCCGIIRGTPLGLIRNGDQYYLEGGRQC